MTRDFPAGLAFDRQAPFGRHLAALSHALANCLLRDADDLCRRRLVPKVI